MSVTAQRLLQLLTERDIKQSVLADAVGATQGAISKIVKGTSTNSRLMPKIAMYLGVSLPWLIGETDDPSINAGESALSNEDKAILTLYHSLEPTGKKAIAEIMRTMAQAALASGAQAKSVAPKDAPAKTATTLAGGSKPIAQRAA